MHDLNHIVYLENSPKKTCALIGEKLCFYNLRETQELAVEVMMVRAKRIYILIIMVNKLFCFFHCDVF